MALALLTVLWAAQSATAVSVPANNSAEIRILGASSTDTIGNPSGIRTFSGATSTLFFNVEGSARVHSRYSVLRILPYRPMRLLAVSPQLR